MSKDKPTSMLAINKFYTMLMQPLVIPNSI